MLVAGKDGSVRFRGGLLAMALLAAPLVAAAQPFQGLYIGGAAGYNLPENDPGSHGIAVEPGGGFAGLGSVGYGLGNGFRFELEGNFREAPLPAVSTAVISSNSGNLHTYGVMANVLYDLDIRMPWLYPYIGGGVGYAWSHFSRQRVFTGADFPVLSPTFATRLEFRESYRLAVGTID
jgi:opacity protein-like surface antigen